MSALLPFVAAIAAGACAMTSADTLSVDDGVVRLRDIADLACVRPEARAQMGALIVAELDPTQREVRLTRAALSTLVRRRVPALAALAPGDRHEIVIGRASRPHSDDGQALPGCSVAARSLQAGEAIARADLLDAPCDSTAPAHKLRYNRRDRAVEAGAVISAGDYLGRVFAPPERMVSAGANATFAVSVGSVRVEQPVTTLQPGQAGEAVFVRDRARQIFSVPVTALRPEATP